jgi:hypothetical protein
MARREKVVTIAADNRDKGKSFLIREMSADAGEWFAIRAMIVMGNAGTSLPDGAGEAGMAGLAAVEAVKGAASAMLLVGLRMLPGVDPIALRPLLDEMKGCIQYKPPGNLPVQSLMDGDHSQIEEIATWLQLRAEVLELHLGFSVAGIASTSGTTPPAVPAT